RRSLSCARRSARSALRSSLLIDLRSSLRRRRASAAVIGAGATGPRRRADSERFGVGRPLGGVVRDSLRRLRSLRVVFPEPVSDESPDDTGSVVAAVSAPVDPAVVCALSFFRPSRFTPSRLV